MKRILFICVALVLFISCDVPGRLEIINKSDQTAYYTYLLINEFGVVDTFNIEVLGMDKSGILFDFGWQWSDKQIKNYSEKIEKIELISVNDTIVMDNQAALEAFFKNNRKGFFKKKIQIVFK